MSTSMNKQIATVAGSNQVIDILNFFVSYIYYLKQSIFESALNSTFDFETITFSDMS